LLISTADSTPTGAPTFAGGSRAGINLGLNLELNVSIPSGTRVVSATDKGRVLVLRSTANPQSNSGCYLITGFDTGSNSYVVDYRSGTQITPDTTIISSSNNVALPTGTINVASTTVFPASGTILVLTDNQVQTVTYTAKTATTFTGCTGGTGIMRTGNGVANNATVLPQATLTVPSTTGFPTSGTLFVYTSTGRQTVTYTGTTATTFTGCSGGTGVIGFAQIVSTTTTTIAAGSNGQSLPQATINVASTTTATTTIAAASNATRLPTATAGTITVASTTGFPTSGNIWVTTDAGKQLVSYTGTTATTFTGCLGGFGLMTTGNAVVAGFNPNGGTIYVATSTGVQKVTYTATNATQFTGCSGGGGSMTTGNLVYFSPNLPPAEATDSMNWYLYEKDGNAPIQGASNGNTNLQYRGNGTSTTPRLILQSPHAIAWQVRICHETVDDSGVGTGGVSSECPLISFAPGYGGNASGDFAVGGPHLHTPLFYNSNSTNFQGGVVGFGDNTNIPALSNSMVYRITIAGDDDGYGVSIFGRRPGNANTPRSYFLTFGLPPTEALPLPPNNEARLFAIGSASSTVQGNNLNDLSWYPGIVLNGNIQGVAMQSAIGAVAIPVSANVTLITYSFETGQQGSPIFDGSAGESPWVGGTELMPVDVIAGIINTWNNSSAANYGFPRLEGRFLGTIAHIREGRANFAEYTTTTDQVGQHMRRGLWILWGGPPPVA